MERWECAKPDPFFCPFFLCYSANFNIGLGQRDDSLDIEYIDMNGKEQLDDETGVIDDSGY